MKIRAEVMDAVQRELDYQDSKWGADKQQSFPGYLAIIRNELNESETGWLTSQPDGRDSALAELVQVAAVALRALHDYGTEGCPGSRWDASPIVWPA